MNNIMKVFCHFDPNGDNTINFEEAIPMIRAFDLSSEELKYIFNEIDTNGDGLLQIEEWICFVESLQSKN